MDYHGKVVTKTNYREYKQLPDVTPEYVMCVSGPIGKRLVDASSEICLIHPDHRCQGRLVNHSKKSANVTNKDVQLPKDRVIVMTAMRPLVPFEQVFYDYVDTTARQLFKPQTSPVVSPGGGGDEEQETIQSQETQSQAEED